MLKISLFAYLLITVEFHNPAFTLELNESNLKLVFAIVRNGEHYPDKYALEYEKRFNKYTFQPGELLQLGKETMYDVGKKLRERYNEYLGDHSLTKYLVKSSGVKNKFSKRTLESALILQEGLRKSEQKYVLNRNWTERQWSTVEDPNYTDRASYYYYNCDKYLEEQNKILQRELREKNYNQTS
ncbi:uncharacterized protein LOC113385885 [Ctenocephalides felis]|uniref:uncharacterized protein LOC113385885 n=1 Tax=Ctenocephalides felis TaxID=7515 RepID=UPI000E6E43E4|nr:uncharacterized protein LOC113385885 [Ctenocephalides felis]